MVVAWICRFFIAGSAGVVLKGGNDISNPDEFAAFVVGIFAAIIHTLVIVNDYTD